VRQDPDHADPAGWYAQPPGTAPTRADAARMKADGIELPPPRRP